MPVTDIPRERWRSFCDQFTRQHQSWIVNVSVSDEGITDGTRAADAEGRMRPLTRSTLFQGITAEEHDGRLIISIIAGLPPNDVTHFIYDPRRVCFLHTEEGAHEGLVIGSNSGQTTLLRFRAAALPEILDGVTEAELLPLSRVGT